MKHLARRLRWFVLWGVFIFWMVPLHGQAWAQVADESEDDVAVVESEITVDQIRLGPSGLRDEFMKQSQNEDDTPPLAQDVAEKKPLVLKEEQVIGLNQNLRKVIEENERMLRNNKDLDLQLRNLRGQRTIEANRLRTITLERDLLKEQTQRTELAQEELERRLAEMQALLRTREQASQTEIAALKEKIGQYNEQGYMPEGSSEKIADVKVFDDQGMAVDILDMINTISQTKDKIRVDEAKIHYNMGNVYFKQGKYEEAIAEYKEAIDLKPEDSNAHFNLAFVSGEYLKDMRTAVAHYRQYLLLNPMAGDAALVKEKILEAELDVRSHVKTHLEKDLHQHHAGFDMP